MEKLPLGFVQVLNPKMKPFVAINNAWKHRIAVIKDWRDRGIVSTDRKSIFETILASNLPEEEKSVDRLRQEAQTVLAGGFISTSKILTGATFHILDNPPIHVRLMDELKNAIPNPANPPPLAELEHLPYLSAVILEALLMNPAVSYRQQRICLEKDIRYKEWIIPAGTPAGMTTFMLHQDPSIFPDPYTFNSERWLPLETKGKSLEKHLFSWSRGSRNCLGINLARAWIYLTLANVFRRFGSDMKLVDTIRERGVDTSDLIIPAHVKDSKGITVKFVGGKE